MSNTHVNYVLGDENRNTKKKFIDYNRLSALSYPTLGVFRGYGDILQRRKFDKDRKIIELEADIFPNYKDEYRVNVSISHPDKQDNKYSIYIFKYGENAKPILLRQNTLDDYAWEDIPRKGKYDSPLIDDLYIIFTPIEGYSHIISDAVFINEIYKEWEHYQLKIKYFTEL